MKQHTSQKGARKEKSRLAEALAVLISCTRNRKRPLPLTEMIKWLEVAIAELGGYQAVADRIGLSSDMLRQFSNIKRLSPPVQELFQKRRIDSVDAATHLARLPFQDQPGVANALASREIDTSDVRAIIQLRQRGHSAPINDLIARVKQSKTRREYVAEFVVRGDRNRKKIMGLVQKYVSPDDIERLELNGALGRLVLTRKGKQALAKTARAHGVPLTRVIPIILLGQGQ